MSRVGKVEVRRRSSGTWLAALLMLALASPIPASAGASQVMPDGYEKQRQAATAVDGIVDARQPALTVDHGINPAGVALQVFTDQASFDAEIGNPLLLTVEDFDSAAVSVGGVSLCSDPINSQTLDGCFQPGDLAEGFSVTSTSGQFVVAIGTAYSGPAHTSTRVGAGQFPDATIVRFDPPVMATSMDVSEARMGGISVVVSVYDDNSGQLGTVAVTPPAPDASAFIGFVAIDPARPISEIILHAAGEGGELVDNLRFTTGEVDPFLHVGGKAIDVADSCASNPGQSNGIVEPGETVAIAVPVTAVAGDFTDVVARLDLPAPPGVTYLVGSSALGTVADGDQADALLSVRIDAGAACLSDITLGITVDGNEGVAQASFDLPVGMSLSPKPANTPTWVPDNQIAGVDSIIEVAEDFVIDDLSVQVLVAHTWVGDLVITLTSPAGTRITLLDRPGHPQTGDGCGNANVDLTFVDGAPNPENICEPIPVPWPVTVAAPVQPLSTFVGENAQGSWTLNVSDRAAAIQGTLFHWQLVPNPGFGSTCTSCDDADVIFRDGFEQP